MNKGFLKPKTLKQKNTSFFTLQELKQKIQQRKILFGQQKLNNQKTKTSENKETSQRTIKNVTFKLDENTQQSISSISPARKVKQLQKSVNSLIERQAFTQKRIKTSSTSDQNYKQTSLSLSNIKLNESQTIWKKKPNKTQQTNIPNSVETLGDNFLSSFRIIFKELVESYFLKLYLQRQTSSFSSQIWIHIFRNTNLQQLSKREIIQEKQIETKKFLSAIFILLKKQFRMSQIQNMVNKYFPNKNYLNFADFEKLFNFKNDFIDFLIDKSYDKKFKSLSSQQLVNQLFKSLIQTADHQKKLRMICRANEDQLIKFAISMSQGPMLKIRNIAAFLDKNQKQSSFGMKLTQAKVVKFLDNRLSKKHTKYQFIKWLKLDNQIFY